MQPALLKITRLLKFVVNTFLLSIFKKIRFEPLLYKLLMLDLITQIVYHKSISYTELTSVQIAPALINNKLLF